MINFYEKMEKSYSKFRKVNGVLGLILIILIGSVFTYFPDLPLFMKLIMIGLLIANYLLFCNDNKISTISLEMQVRHEVIQEALHSYFDQIRKRDERNLERILNKLNVIEKRTESL